MYGNTFMGRVQGLSGFLGKDLFVRNDSILGEDLILRNDSILSED